MEVTGAPLSNSSMLEGLSQDPASVCGDSVPHLPPHLPLLLLLKQRLFPITLVKMKGSRERKSHQYFAVCMVNNVPHKLVPIKQLMHMNNL